MAGITVSLTRRCNLKCKMCGASKTHELNRDMSLETFYRFVDMAKRTTIGHEKIDAIFFTGFGEGTLNKNFYEMLKYARNNFKYIKITTNAVALSEELIKNIIKTMPDRIEISLTGIEQKIYGQFQGYGYGKAQQKLLLKSTLSNINKLLKYRNHYKTKTVIAMRYIMEKENIAHLFNYSRFFAKFGGGVDEIFAYPIFTSKTHSKNKKCSVIGTTCAIDYDGGVSPCCMDFGKELELGNIYHSELRKIMNTSERIIELKKNNESVMEFDCGLIPEVCRKCDNTLYRNRLDRIKNREVLICCHKGRVDLLQTLQANVVILFKILFDE